MSKGMFMFKGGVSKWVLVSKLGPVKVKTSGLVMVFGKKFKV